MAISGKGDSPFKSAWSLGNKLLKKIHLLRKNTFTDSDNIDGKIIFSDWWFGSTQTSTDIIVTPTSVSLILSGAEPTIIISGGAVDVIVNPNVVPLTIALLEPTIIIDSVYESTTLLTTLNVLEPTISIDSIATPAEVTTTISILQPTVKTWYGNLRRWNGSQWVDATIKAYTGGSWQIKPLKRWIGTEWKEVDINV